MGRKGFERISQREYARRLGVSNEAVRKAIEAGKISAGWDKKEQKILFEKANEEWGQIHLENKKANEEVLARVKEIPAPERKLKKTINADEAFKDAENELISDLESNHAFKLDTTVPYAEALRKLTVYKMGKEAMGYLEMAGTLVNKAEVYKQLFGFGQNIRTAILAVPDRAIDEILSQPNRAEAYQTLTKYLHEALEKLSEVDQLNFQPYT